MWLEVAHENDGLLVCSEVTPVVGEPA